MYLDTIAPIRYCPAVTEQGDRKSKRQIGPRIDENLSKEVRILGIREGRGFNDLIEEALRDLLKKYREKSKGK